MNSWHEGSGLGSGRSGSQAPALGLVRLSMCMRASLAAVPALHLQEAIKVGQVHRSIDFSKAGRQQHIIGQPDSLSTE